MNALDEEPPSKRRRTREDSEDDKLDIYHHLIMLLNGSTPASPVLNLSNLHTVAQYVRSFYSKVELTSSEQNARILIKTKNPWNRNYQTGS